MIEPVAGTVFDFTKAKPVGDGIRSDDPQVVIGKGFDHNWVLDPHSGAGLNLAATLSAKGPGHSLNVWTDQPGIQFYSGNFLDGRSTASATVRIGRATGSLSKRSISLTHPTSRTFRPPS